LPKLACFNLEHHKFVWIPCNGCDGVWYWNGAFTLVLLVVGSINSVVGNLGQHRSSVVLYTANCDLCLIAPANHTAAFLPRRCHAFANPASMKKRHVQVALMQSKS
jgi:hypothetical protein